MKQDTISSLQLFHILLGFEFGTAIILGLGEGAKQDSWMVILLGSLCSLIVMWVYSKLASYYPGKSLVQIIPELIGKFFALPFILLYIFYFVYSAGRACRDFGGLIETSILVETPIVLIIGSFIVLIIYCLRSGVVTFGRMGEAVFPIFLLSLIIVWILLLTVKNLELSNLSPVLGNGIGPVLKGVFLERINFPFSETIIILMFIPFLKDPKHVWKVGSAVILSGGILLTINSILIILVLGPEIYERDYFPLLSATRMVSIADFLERFDAVIILMMVAGVFFKVGAWTLGAVIGITQLLHLQNHKSVVLGLGTIIIPLSLLIGENFVVHLYIGLEIVVKYVQTLLQIILPVLFLCIAFTRNRFMNK